MFSQPMYKFRTGALGPIDFAISTRLGDYGKFLTVSEAETFAKMFRAFSVLWLENHGWGPVSTHTVPRWNLEYRSYGYKASEQDLLRERIFADFLSPLNMGKNILQWQGLQKISVDNTYHIGSIPKT